MALQTESNCLMKNLVQKLNIGRGSWMCQSRKINCNWYTKFSQTANSNNYIRLPLSDYSVQDHPQIWFGSEPTTNLIWFKTIYKSDLVQDHPQIWFGSKPFTNLIWFKITHKSYLVQDHPQIWFGLRPPTNLIGFKTTHKSAKRECLEWLIIVFLPISKEIFLIHQCLEIGH